MGRFIIEALAKVEFEDRVLAHLERVITSKLRRNESFTFTWRDDISLGGGRTTVWLHPSSNILFKFHGSRPPQLNRDWLQALTEVAAGPHGLYIVPEPQGPPAHREAREPMTFHMTSEEQGLSPHGPVILGTERPPEQTH